MIIAGILWFLPIDFPQDHDLPSYASCQLLPKEDGTCTQMYYAKQGVITQEGAREWPEAPTHGPYPCPLNTNRTHNPKLQHEALSS